LNGGCGIQTLITAISCPDAVETGQPFTIAVTIENQEYKEDAQNVTAAIDLPSGFSLISGSTETFIGAITAGENTTVSWTAKAAEPGNFSITVSINSANEAPDYRIITLHVKPSVWYILTHTTYAGLPSFVWIVLICAGSGIVVAIVLKKRYQESIDHWSMLEKKFPYDNAILINKGVDFREIGRFDEAGTCLEETLERDQNSAHACNKISSNLQTRSICIYNCF